LFRCGETGGGSEVKIYYILSMSLGLKELLEETASWPKEDQDELAEVAAEIEARRSGRYAMTDAERAAVNNGLQQVRRGEFASDAEMQLFWMRFGVAWRFATARKPVTTSRTSFNIFTIGVPPGRRT
jgi:hypothetical protein